MPTILREVDITKLYLHGSICSDREARKRDKYMIELATRAFDAAMRRLIVWCLNEWQKEVKRAQEDPDNQ
jgi:hypothetical protein